ncbi:MAG TPA: tyrosine-protein phosphatase [Phycisphaerae bacterium]|nr:tyrosine-protein phosphatase [Phycisphaerae bacterium]
MGGLYRKRLGIPLLVALAVAIASAAVWWQLAQRLPKRFATVVEGRLYRSGQISPAQLERLVRGYGIRTVVSLLDREARVSVAERRTAERLGIAWHCVPLPGDGASTPAERAQVKTLLFDPDAGSTLVHCAAGVNRTGLAVGMYRLHVQGWPLEQVLEEMRAFGFEDRAHHANLRDALAAEAALAHEKREAPPQGESPGS